MFETNNACYTQVILIIIRIYSLRSINFRRKKIVGENMPFCVIRFVVVKKDLEMGLDRVIMDQSYGCNLRNSDILRLLNFFFCSIVTLINLKQNRSSTCVHCIKVLNRCSFYFSLGLVNYFYSEQAREMRCTMVHSLKPGPGKGSAVKWDPYFHLC